MRASLSPHPFFAVALVVILGAATAPEALAQTGPVWEPHGIGLEDADSVDVEVQPGEPPTVYTVANNEVWRVTGVEGTWERVPLPPNPVPLEDVPPMLQGLEIHPRHRSRLVVLSFLAIRESFDDGATWLTFVPECMDTRLAAPAPSQPGFYYFTGSLQSSGCGRVGLCHFFRWDRATEELICVRDSPEGLNSPEQIAVDSADASRVYAIDSQVDGGSDFYLSETAGNAWERIDPGFEPHALAADPVTAEVVYATDKEEGGFWRSLDGGHTWEELGTPLPGAAPSQIVVDPVEPSHVYVRTTETIHASDDGGLTWTSLDAGLPPGALRDLALDPADPAVLYVARQGPQSPIWRLERRFPTEPCAPDEFTLCLGADERFRVRAVWQDFQFGAGLAQARPRTSDTGSFWFFDPANTELVVKALDGRPVNEHFWLFYGSLTNVPFTLVVTDTLTGEVQGYDNPPRRFASRGDTRAFPENLPPLPPPMPAPADPALDGDVPPEACQPDATTLCLGEGDRFQVEVDWEDFVGGSGPGRVVGAPDGDTGFFWFFQEDNFELAVKVLDARSVNGHFWVFYGSLTNVEFRLRVTDTATGRVRTYLNPSGRFASRGDTGAFASVPWGS